MGGCGGLGVEGLVWRAWWVGRVVGGGGGFGLGSAGFHFLNYNKRFPLRKYKNSFNIRARNFHFPKYEEFLSGWMFSCFFGLALRKCAR